MEGGTFLTDSIQRAFGRFVEIRLHNDHPDPEIAEANKALQRKRFGTWGMPYYALLSPDGKTLFAKDGGVMSEEEFLAFLKHVP